MGINAMRNINNGDILLKRCLICKKNVYVREKDGKLRVIVLYRILG